MTPLVCIHPVSGRADAYRVLAEKLAYPGPIVGLDAPPVPPDGYVLADLARDHLCSAERYSPLRIALLGWSIGGVIAAEMCNQMVARGGEVTFLGILDSRAPVSEMRSRPVDRESLGRMFLQHAALTREQEPRTFVSATTSELLATLHALGAGAEFPDEETVEQRFATFAGLVRALFVHALAPLAVPIHLFEARDAHPRHPKPPSLGWETLAPAGVVHTLVGGNHFDLLAPHRTEELARVIDRWLTTRTLQS